MNRPLPTVRAVPLDEFPTAYPHLRFAVRFPDGRALAHDAGARHPLAGTGKLVLACAVARLAERHPGLLGKRLVLADEHRSAVRTGTLRLMGGELALTVDDALALVIGTGDARCVLAVQGFLAAQGYDVLGEARTLVAGLGLETTEIAGLESEASWGEGLVGETTPNDLCTLLDALPERVLGWMGQAFEPAGLASALPGFGPRTVTHQTVAGWELTGGPVDPSDDDAGDGGERDAAQGYASVLTLPGAVVAAYYPATHPDGAVVTPLDVSTAFGTLGLAVWRSCLSS